MSVTLNITPLASLRLIAAARLPCAEAPNFWQSEPCPATLWSRRNARHMLQLCCLHDQHGAARSMERCLSGKPCQASAPGVRVLPHHDCALCRGGQPLSTGCTRDVHADPGLGSGVIPSIDPRRELQAVIGVLDAEVVPLLRKCSLAGHAEYKTHNEASSHPCSGLTAACLAAFEATFRDSPSVCAQCLKVRSGSCYRRSTCLILLSRVRRHGVMASLGAHSASASCVQALLGSSAVADYISTAVLLVLHPLAQNVPLLNAQIFAKHPAAADMLLDILSDRGFSGAYIVNERIVPARINPDTWKVENEIDLIHKFRRARHRCALLAVD